MKKKREIRTPVNDKIRSREVRLVSDDGEHFGVVDISFALEKAKEKGVDLVQMTNNVEPPVCKIIDFGKYNYEESKKKKKKEKTDKVEEKVIRLGFAISEHDMDVRVKSAVKFLQGGDSVKSVMPLKGRQKALQKVGESKLNYFLDKIKEELEIKIDKDIKKEPRGLTVTVTKK